MQIGDLEIGFAQHPEIALAKRELQKGRETHVLLSGLHASARALMLAELRAPLFVIFDNAESAQYVYADLKTLGANVQYFPSAQRRRTMDEAAAIQRTETLTALASNNVAIVVTYPEAIAEPTPKKEELSAISFQLKVGQEIQLSAISRQLSDLGFEHVDFVFQPGQYAVRGSIVDIYSYSHDNPYRLDFFGDEIDSIRTFDIEDQLSKARVETAEIVGKGQSDKEQSTIIDYLTEDFVWMSNDFSIVRFKLDGLGLLGYLGSLENHKTIELAEKSTFPTHSKIAFDTMPQPVFHKQFDILTEDLRKHIDDGYKIYILAEQQKQLDRLKAIFESLTSVSPEDGLSAKRSVSEAVSLDFGRTPDLYPAIALTCERLGITLQAEGTERLRYKECDRLEAVRMHQTRHDHRMAMALLVAGFPVDDTDCIRKSYPAFLEQFNLIRQTGSI